jgi:hypothetical protein
MAVKPKIEPNTGVEDYEPKVHKEESRAEYGNFAGLALGAAVVGLGLYYGMGFAFSVAKSYLPPYFAHTVHK